MSLTHTKSTRELRIFGFAFGSGLTILGSLLHFWRQAAAGPYVLGLAAVVLLSGALYPPLLRPLEWLMSRLFRLVTAVITYVVLVIAFFLVMTPIGLLLRLLGKDLLAMKPAREQATFWVPVETDGPATRPDKPY